MADQQYCLRWNNHQSTLISVFDSLQERGCMVDCTLAAEGQSLQAHKVVLSACSPYLEDLLSKHYDKHPILLLKDVKFEELKAMMDYMYRGEVNVAQDKLNTFLRAAESLQIKGLSDGGTDPPDSGGTTSTKRTAKGTPVSVRSNQLTVRKTNLDDSSSRDGSTSPSQRKRRRRRGSETSDIETSNVSDGKQSTAAAAPVSGPSETSPIVPASAPSDDNILSSITESAETENATDSGFSSAVPQEINNVIRDRDNALIEPKTEYVEDDGQDLNLEDEDGLFRAGPSHARGTYEGDGDDDVYMTNQDSGANAQDLLIMHPAVSEAAVIGEPHEYGEAPRALVRLADGAHVTEEELCQFISAKVAPHKQLRAGITFISAPFPRTASGKLQRKKLRALLQDPDDSFTSSCVSSGPASPAAAAAQVEAEAAPVPPAEPLAPTAEPAAAPAPAHAAPSASEQLIEAEAEAQTAARVQGQAADDSLDAPEAQTACCVATSPEPQTQPPASEPTYRPSLASITSLSTIYSESPVSTPPVMDDSMPSLIYDSMPSLIDDSMPSLIYDSLPSLIDDSFATPAAVSRLREAAKVPLPASEPNSSAALASPLPAHDALKNGEDVPETPGSQGSAEMDIASPMEVASPEVCQLAQSPA